MLKNDAQQYFSDMHDRLALENKKSSTMPELSRIITLALNEDTRSKRKKWKWSKTNSARGNDVLRIITALKQYWPLTERHGYYRLLSDNCVKGNHWNKFGKADEPRVVDLYGTVGELLKWLRIHEHLEWNAISDETRILTPRVGFENSKQFIRQEIDGLFSGYSRCVAQDQQNYIEVWIEKQTLLHIIKPIADKYCRRVLCARGYSSITFINEANNRINKALTNGLNPVILCFMDWDPSGENMVHSMMQTFEEDFGMDLSKVQFERCGINPCHFDNLHCDPVPIKPTDARTENFIKRHGETCFELDALHPAELENLVEESIQRFTDMDSVSCNLNIQTKDREFLKNLKNDAEHYILQSLEAA